MGDDKYFCRCRRSLSPDGKIKALARQRKVKKAIKRLGETENCTLWWAHLCTQQFALWTSAVIKVPESCCRATRPNQPNRRHCEAGKDSWQKLPVSSLPVCVSSPSSWHAFYLQSWSCPPWWELRSPFRWPPCVIQFHIRLGAFLFIHISQKWCKTFTLKRRHSCLGRRDGSHDLAEQNWDDKTERMGRQ